MKSQILLILFIFLHLTGFSQVRKYSNEFLSIGVGARGQAMASAQVASVTDATVGFWNPAGLMDVRGDFNVAFMHNEYFAGIAKFDYLSFAGRLKDNKRVIGVSVMRFAVDDIPYTLDLFEDDGSINYANVRSFSIGDYAFLFSYAQDLPVKNLSIGVNFKVIYRNAGSFASAWGFGLDAGLRYSIKNFQFGFMAKDVTSTFNAWSFSFNEKEKEILVSTDNIIPSNSLEITVPKFILGAAYNFNIKDKFFILPEIDFEITTDKERNVPIRTKAISIDPRFGLELNYGKIVYLRGGIGNIQQTQDENDKKVTTFQPNIGIGLQIKMVNIDYAFTDIGNASEALYSHVISLNLAINKKKK